MRLRRAEHEDRRVKEGIHAQHLERKRNASEAIADRDAAVADLRETNRK